MCTTSNLQLVKIYNDEHMTAGQDIQRHSTILLSKKGKQKSGQFVHISSKSNIASALAIVQFKRQFLFTFYSLEMRCINEIDNIRPTVVERSKSSCIQIVDEEGRGFEPRRRLIQNLIFLLWRRISIGIAIFRGTRGGSNQPSSTGGAI